MQEHIPIGADHAGYELKQILLDELRRRGIEPDDVGTHSTESTDYADYAHVVAKAGETGAAARGVLVCGSGLGMSYAASRPPGVRAGVAWSPEVAALSREHHDANVLVLPARCIDPATAGASLVAWLDTPFAGGRRA